MNTNKSEKIYKGNIKITQENCKEWSKKLKYTEKIGGDLYINSNVELKADKLESVGGYLYINSNVELKADKLESVGGYLSIHSNVELKALKSVSGDLYINSNVELKADKLESVGGYLYINSNVELKADKLESVGGDLYINSNVELKALKSVSGDLYINSKISNELEKRLWKNNKKKKWYLSDKSSEWLLSQNGNFEYRLNNVVFSKEWFDKIRKDELTPDEVFAIDNIEHRRIAYEYMDKTKMKQLKDYKVLDEGIDEKGNKERVVSFTIQKLNEPLKFYNCICPSSKREYFIGTSENDCLSAKCKSFGLLPNDVVFIEEW